MELLKKLYCIHSKSGKEHEMLNFLVNWLFEKYPSNDVDIDMDKSGNLYVTKGNAETYPCVVAHVDQVQYLHSDDFEAVETDDIIFGWSKTNKRFEGLGADDKNGVWIALQCLMKYDVIKIALFVSEEIGCVGSDAADMTFFNDCRFVLQCDRRGDSDFITTASCTELCSDEFSNATHYELFGYAEERGLMTDVMTLKRNGLQVSCANISCGYYQPHTDDEYTVKSDLLNCLDLVQYIIENCTQVYPHKYEYKPYTPINGYGYGYGSKYNEYKGYGYGGYGGYGGVSNGYKTSTEKKTVEEKTAATTEEEINSFFENEENVDTRNFNDDCFEFDDETQPLELSEEIRDELYDVIYALLMDCPNASYDMIRSALLMHYENLDEKDMYSVYGEVKYDMKKYLQMC